MHLTQLIDSLRRAFRWYRRWFAAALAAFAVFAAISAVAQQSSGSVPVVVAARTIPGGTTLTAADLSVARVPASVVAEGAFDTPELLLGQQVITAIPARAILTSTNLLATGTSVGEGKLALPVRFSDSTTMSALQVGSRIDVLGQTGDSYAVIAANLRVVAVPDAEQGGVLSANTDGLVMVEVDASQAGAITAATSAGSMSYALH